MKKKLFISSNKMPLSTMSRALENQNVFNIIMMLTMSIRFNTANEDSHVDIIALLVLFFIMMTAY